MRLLLHTCCAPCLIAPLEELKHKGFKVSAYFYNPNIHPFLEYNSRKDALGVLASGIEIICPEYKPQEFFREVSTREESPLRCALCWKLRLKKTALWARKEGFEYFSTTLLVSPYQDHEQLKKLGEEVAAEAGVGFYYADFRPGFRKAHEQAKAKGIYCQKYCGCLYSKIERCRKSPKP